jgi:hypothetical protein
MERKLIMTVSGIISGKRFSIVDGSMCVCLEDHETVDHFIWKCSHFSKSMPDSEVITVWHLQGDPNTRLACPIELEGF